ncbi:Fe-S cluster assembly protein SufD [Microbacterium gorillae]|uniref:Fe-S cluster assembly protein SufD n=1 Tax=Microbacterium gorillae TaxID=1231063 RepID=UPI00058AC073|nr:Fe-S cluster assembly protein SufD [Microbacterium gorillae]
MTTPTEAPVVVPGSLAHSDGPFVPVQTRSERPTSFDPAELPMPTGREVNFMHTPVDRLRALLTDEPGDDGAVQYELDGVEAHLGAEPVASGDEFFRPEDRMAAIAYKQAPGVLHLSIGAGEELSEPLTLPITGTGADKRAFGHIVIEAGENARGTVVLDHKGSAQYAQNVEIIARDGSDLTVVSVQRWDEDAVHAAAHQARVDKDAKLTHIIASLSGGVVRVNPSVQLAGSGAESKMYGVSFADPGEHLESQVYLHHKGAHTVGNVLYKSALQGETARTVWVGDVLIGPDATATDSYEANRNLVLTTGARADSIPNLEIETGDILGAGHASATGRFDDEQLFYLQARGIPEEEARRLVVVGFLGEIVQKIGIDSLEQELFDAIQVELDRGVA